MLVLPVLALFACAASASIAPPVVELDSAGDVLVSGSGRSEPLLQCRTLATAGPKNWGHAIVYCPEGTVMTGGGMQSNFGPFERSHPYYNGHMCDNNHGWGAGICFARCCSMPGYEAVPAPSSGKGGKNRNSKGKKKAQKGGKGGNSGWAPGPPDEDEIGRRPNPPVIKVHDNVPVLRLFTRAVGKKASAKSSVLRTWATASKKGKGLCPAGGQALGEFHRVSSCGKGARSVMYRMVVKFYPLTRGIWNFHLGSTFANGGVAYVDGKVATSARGRKFGWRGSWADTANILSTGEVELKPHQWHTVDIFGFGAAGGDDEPMDMKFQYRPAAGWKGGEAPWKTVETRNLQEACD